MKYTLPILFAVGTALCWGLYGPTVANARSTTGQWSPFKPYVFIGVAYLVLACGGGLLGMSMKGDTYDFFGDHSPATTWGFFAGSLGALGALSLTSAMLSFDGKPKPQLVMPIVFGGAVSITAIVSVIQHRATGASPWLWVGMVTVVVGIVLVAYFTPHGGPGHGKKPEAEQAASAPAEPGKTAETPST